MPLGWNGTATWSKGLPRIEIMFKSLRRSNWNATKASESPYLRCPVSTLATSHRFLLLGEQVQSLQSVEEAVASPCSSLPPVTLRPDFSGLPHTDLTTASRQLGVYDDVLFSRFLHDSLTAQPSQTVQGQAGEQLEPCPLLAGVWTDTTTLENLSLGIY